MSLPSSTVAWPRTMQAPAYHAVSPCTTLQPVSGDASHTSLRSQPDAAPIASRPKKVEWPLAVREYVRRAFDPANAMPSISSAEMQKKLRETISYYAERNAQEEVNWPTYPLPQELLLEERRLAALAISAAAPANGLSLEHTNPTNAQSKKRKSQDADELHAQSPESSTAPGRKTNLASRMTFSDGHNDKRHKKNMLSEAQSKLQSDELEKRRQRFHVGHNGNKASAPPWGPLHKDHDEMPTGPVVGTSSKLEKSYFRLTAPPQPETVRPLAVLEKALGMLVKKWKTEKNYNYICNQFKSLRQDLTVQHIKNAFTVKVYEIHARISLEKGDLGEYNQCQTQLKALYGLKLGGNPAEFAAYRILYFVYTCNKTDMNDMLAELTLADKNQKWIQHALDVRSSLALGNYHRFFKLYLEAENMGGYLMDMFVERERLAALANIFRGYPHVTLRFLTDELGFDNDETCRDFLHSHGAQNAFEGQEDGIRVKSREWAAHFEALRAAAFSKVDIKGQI